jgi:hypothetical protein
LERQYVIFAAAAAAAFAALIVFGLFNPLQQSEGDDGPSVIKAKKGEQVFVRYSPSVVKMIQDLPMINSVEVEVSSELQNTNLAGLGGQIRYDDMEITYIQNGKVENVNDNDFKTIEYRFFPDSGNKTKYVYENVQFVANSVDSQVIVAVKPLSSAKVGEHYTVNLVLRTGGAVDYQIAEKTIEVVP